MDNKDICRKYLAHNDMVRVIVIDATKMVNDARDMHCMSNVATAAFGRTLMASTMIAYMLKEEGHKLTVQLKGDGPLSSIVICGDKSLNMKGYVSNPEVELPLNSISKLDVAKAVGKGYINIIKDIGLKEPYIGFSELITSEIAEDFAYYFNISEQTPSVVSLGVNIGVDNKVQKAAGFIIQPLPDTDSSVIDLIESINLNISSVTNLMLDLNNIDDVAKTITGDNNIKLIDEKEPLYKCDCNEERIEKAIISLGKKEANEVLSKNGGVFEITCHFCNKVYKYDEEKLNSVFEK